MSEPGENPVRRRALPAMVWVAFVVALLFSAVFLGVLGTTLGLYFGGIVLAATLLPAMSLTSPRLADRVLIAAAVADGIALIWLVSVPASSVTLVQCILCYLVLLGWCTALLGLATLFARIIPSIPAAAIVVLIGMLWLSCPIWLHAFDIPWMLKAHPLFVLNSVLQQLGMWTERPIAYRYLLTLGQDVPFELPHSILPCAGVHLLVGLIALSLGSVSRQR